jgi:hypothetical protein
MDGWALMATRAHEASTFSELREASEGFGRVLGEVAARMRALPEAKVWRAPSGRRSGRRAGAAPRDEL